MKKVASLVGILIVTATVVNSARALASDRDQIRALEDRFAQAFRAKDVNRIMSVYVSDATLSVFDVVPPREYVGAAAYRKG